MIEELDDLIARLHRFAHRSQRGSHNTNRWKLIEEAARALTSLEAENAELRKALVAFADAAERMHEENAVCQPFIAIYKQHGDVIEAARAIAPPARSET